MIPETYRREALYAALHARDGVGAAGGPDHEGAPIRVEFPPEGHPDHDDDARRYVKRVAGGLGFSFASEGPFEAKLTPDAEHALAGLKGAR